MTARRILLVAGCLTAAALAAVVAVTARLALRCPCGCGQEES